VTTTHRPCPDCGAQTRQAFPTTTAYVACTRCGHVHPAVAEQKRQAVCDECGQLHEATYSHEGQWGEGPIYAVVCTQDWLTSYYTAEGLVQL